MNVVGRIVGGSTVENLGPGLTFGGCLSIVPMLRAFGRMLSYRLLMAGRRNGLVKAAEGMRLWAQDCEKQL